MTAASERSERVIRKAQEGRPIDEVFPRGGTRRGARSAAAASLSVAEREQVIDTFTALIEGLYTHLPLKRAMYAIDPLQRLRLLRQRVSSIDDVELHHQLAATVTGLRDAHTRYIGPARLEGRAARLPFLVEAFGSPEHPRYVVTKIASRTSLATHAHFKPGVEIRWWNAVPIDRAVERHAEEETGGRPDTRRSRALESLTFRALRYGPPPDEHWVIVGYLDEHRKERDVRVEWRVVEPGRAKTSGQPRGHGTLAYAIDPAAETTRRVKKLLFAPELWRAEQAPNRSHRMKAAAAPVEVGRPIPTSFPDTITAKVVATPSGRFGHLRLWSFDLVDDRPFIDEVVRLLALLPDTGLIVDLRGNPGGLIWAAERMLQLLTPKEITPTRFSMLATALTRAMARAPQNQPLLDLWRESLNDAVSTGELYSRTAPLTPHIEANDIGQVYGGPVVAVADANTYSAGDLFAAGFNDNEVGILVTVGEATGAGGANVWSPEDVHDALLGTEFEQPQLPAGISYTLAVRRATRVGAAEGMAIEDLGVRGEPHPMTRRDLTEDNRDLNAFCGRLLKQQPHTSMTIDDGPPGSAELLVTTKGLDRLDVIADSRPRESLAVRKRTTTIAAADPGSTLEVRGYDGDELRQVRRR